MHIHPDVLALGTPGDFRGYQNKNRISYVGSSGPPTSASTLCASEQSRPIQFNSIGFWRKKSQLATLQPETYLNLSSLPPGGHQLFLFEPARKATYEALEAQHDLGFVFGDPQIDATFVIGSDRCIHIDGAQRNRALRPALLHAQRIVGQKIMVGLQLLTVE